MKKYLILFVLCTLSFVSCSPEYEIMQSVGSVILTADQSVKAQGDTIIFTVRDGNGVDLTADAEILVNGEPIEGNEFVSDAVGSYEIIASVLGIQSTPLSIRFHDGSETNFVKRVLVEDYTGTWCGYCPRVAFAVEQVHAQTDKMVAVAIHRPSSNISSSVYDPYNYDTSELEDFIDVPGYPKGLLNRRTQWTFPEDLNVAQVVSLTQGENPKLGLALQPVINGNTITVDVNVKFSDEFSNLKLVVYVLENGLIYDQHNYTTFYGGAALLPNFEHNHVLRAVLTPLLGEGVNNSETVTNNIYTKTFTATMPENISNSANIEFVAFIVNQNGDALNVRKATPGENQEFEEL